jgi:hypothetical protein
LSDRRSRRRGLGRKIEVRVDRVVVRAADRGFDELARLIEVQELADVLERARQRERHIPLPARIQALCGLVQAVRIQKGAEQERTEADEDGDPGRLESPRRADVLARGVLVGRRRLVPVDRAAGLPAGASAMRACAKGCFHVRT